MADTGTREYTPAPVWVSVNACRSEEVQRALYGKVITPAPRPQPAFVNDQQES